MAGNPKTSKWYDTPESARKRKHIKLTLSEAALARLEQMAEERPDGSRSAVVEALILAAKNR